MNYNLKICQPPVTDNGEAVPSRRLLSRSTSYIPYGEVFVEESSAGWQSPYYFNSKELDEETGLYYYGARYLNPTETRWLSVDNKFEKFPGLSPYHYCHSNPVKLVDPDGNEDYFSEEGKYLGWAGEKEGYKLVDEKSWRLAKKADLYGGNAQTYNGGSDAKSIINFMLEKLTER